MIPNANTTDWGAIASWIALAVAVISPVITTIISNHHQSQLKHLQIIESHGLDVIESYIDLSAKAIINKKVSDEYKINYAKIFLYAPVKIYADIIKLNAKIHSLSSSSQSSAYDESTNDNPLHFSLALAVKKKECEDLLVKICKKLNYNNL